MGAFIIFGSLVRGNWDKYSDLDLDVVLKDASEILVKQEVKNVIEKLKSTHIEILLYFEEFTNEFVKYVRIYLKTKYHDRVNLSERVIALSCKRRRGFARAF